MPDNHALLSASSSYRWINCPPSARLAEQLPQTTSAYAEAGSLAHSIAELKARKYFVEPMSLRTYNSRLKKLKASPHYDKGMDSATDNYLDALKGLAMSYGGAPFVALETRVDLAEYVPEGFGTADCVMAGGDLMDVCDYKNGSGVPVRAEHNTQLMLYALGALRVYGPIFGDSIKRVRLTIVQPNADGVETWETSRAELEDWGETTVKPAAALAYAGQGNYNPGPWCDAGFCPARARCTARAKLMLELDSVKSASPDPALLANIEIGDALTRGRELSKWVKSLEDYAFSAILAGEEIPGYKVVEGRGSRKWAPDADSAFETLKARGVDEAFLWVRSPVTPPGLEKALGKETFGDLAQGVVAKEPGKPALVPDSDKRPPYNPAAMAFSNQ